MVGRVGIVVLCDGDEIARLRAGLEFERSEAEYERRRQRTFQEQVWASDAFSQKQKQMVTEMLRTLDEAANWEPPCSSS